MNFSQESPGSMGEAGGYWDGVVNGDDSFHDVINMLDFPLESVEGDKCVAEEDWEAQFPSLGPFSSEIVQEFSPVYRSDFAEDEPYNFVQNNAASDRKLIPVTEFSSTNFPLDSSHPRNPSLLQTPSLNSVLESSSSCSAGKNLSTSSKLHVPVRTRTKISRSLTFSRWHLISPLTPPKKILHSKGEKKKKMQLSQHPNESDLKEESYYQHMPYKRCTNCQAEKTPQWRAGPMGPNTLCNACGVCYRKRRLLPEYRLIASHGSNTEKFSFTRAKEKKIKLSSEIKEDSTNQLPEDSHVEDITYQLVCKRCTLCNVTKTPQRKEGPMGSKMLCNARGVRSRSGRLLLESLPSPDPENNERMNIRNKEKKKEPSGLLNDSEGMGFTTHQPMEVKRCTHCQVEKTPQWREGPMGPRTLCNACGVRYRSGRLVPEYRPAASPTFVPSLHSNKHRKVIEMRENLIPKVIV